ncbi:hypothetical protein SUGI_0234560 [Cryptomeria japonica]|nr:hypothetical protein SUGI_0234560 [Cryptomeria japonica]
MDIQNMTHLADEMAIRKIANSINVPDDWFGGDPCLPSGYACTGIVCNEEKPSRVIILNLTNFGLCGHIPPSIASLAALTQLLLGSNNLSGSIPNLSSLKNLTTLQLQNNQLTGRIPKSLAKLRMLNQLYLQNNELDGTLTPELTKPGLDLRFISDTILLDEGHAKEYHRLAVEYTEEEIKAATNNYSTLIGKGGFGSVFFGTLSGYDVAVKILSSTSNQGQQEFEIEVTLLCRLYHKNLVNLIGYSKLPFGALARELLSCGKVEELIDSSL